MNILLTHRPSGAYGFISDGWYNAFRDRGHKVVRWDGLEKSWLNFNPSLYIGCSGHQQSILPKNNRGNCKIAIHCNPFGPVDIPGINESEDNIRWTLNQKPDCVFGYGMEGDRLLWSFWESKFGLKWVPMPNAGDKTLFKDLGQDREFDIVYLGGRWDYKALTIDEYLIPVLKSNQLNCKLYGWGNWPDKLCSGILADDKVNAFFNLGKIGPCISERHSHTHGIDIPERAFKVALSGTMVIHDCTITIRSMVPSIVVASTPAQFYEYCHYFARPENVEERRQIAQKQKEEVLSAHTYHHRLSGLLDALEFKDEARRMLEI